MRERFFKSQKRLESPETNTELVYSHNRPHPSCVAPSIHPVSPASLQTRQMWRHERCAHGRWRLRAAGFPACELRLIETAADEAIKTWRDRWRSSKWDWQLQAARCFKGKETLAGESTTKVICLLLIFIRFSLSHVLGFKCLLLKIQSINKIRFRRLSLFVLN